MLAREEKEEVEEEVPEGSGLGMARTGIRKEVATCVACAVMCRRPRQR